MEFVDVFGELVIAANDQGDVTEPVRFLAWVVECIELESSTASW